MRSANEVLIMNTAMPKAKKRRRSVPEVNMDLFAKRVSDYLHKSRNFDKTKAEIADDLGVSLSTYLLYERGEPGPKGVQLSFLAAVAKRNGIPRSHLVAQLGDEAAPPIAADRQALGDLVEEFSSVSDEDLATFMATLREFSPRPSRYIPNRPAWVIHMVSCLCALPRIKVTRIEEQILEQLAETQGEEKWRERMSVILAEFYALAKDRIG